MRKRNSITIAVLACFATKATFASELISVESSKVIKDSYIVVFNDSKAHDKISISEQAEYVKNQSAMLSNKYGIKVSSEFSTVLNGAVISASSSQIKYLLNEPSIKFIEQDQVITLEPIISKQDIQNNATWGLDRIDQEDLPLDSSYSYDYDGTGVTAYIIDSGINLNHNDFGNRARNGANFSSDTGFNDCNGHGTHVAGTVGGTTYGVAKNVDLVSVKVFGCSGSGSTSGVINALNWSANDASGPSVINMSLGGGSSTAMNNAVRNARNAGVTVVVAAGNNNASACTKSPASAPEAITVGSTTSTDARSSFSNFGTCVDIFAPGSSIRAASHTSNTGTRVLSGTSMAAPHVAGAVALLLDETPSLTPQEVDTLLGNNSSRGNVTNPGTGSPNELLYIRSNGSDPGLDLSISNAFYEFGPCQGYTRTGFISWSTAPDANSYRLEYQSGSRWYNVTSGPAPFAAYNVTTLSDRSVSMRVSASNGSVTGDFRSFRVRVPKCGFNAPQPF